MFPFIYKQRYKECIYPTLLLELVEYFSEKLVDIIFLFWCLLFFFYFYRIVEYQTIRVRPPLISYRIHHKLTFLVKFYSGRGFFYVYEETNEIISSNELSIFYIVGLASPFSKIKIHKTMCAT